MSWLFSQALVEAYSEENSLGGEPCAELNVMPTQRQFWRNDKTMDVLSLSPFGLTWKPLTEKRGMELLTWFLGDFPVKISVVRAQGKASLEKEVDSGKSLLGSFAKFNPLSPGWKTLQCSLLGELTEYSGTWPKWGSMRNGVCYQREKLVPRTKGKECGFWPTPIASPRGPDFAKAGQPGSGGDDLATAVAKKEKFPTPSFSDATRSGVMTENMTGQSLVQVVNTLERFPTPCAADGAKGGRGDLYGKINNSGRQKKIPTPTSSMMTLGDLEQARFAGSDPRRPKYADANQVGAQESGGQLNPPWVEWLMGWIIGWTELKPLVMDKYHGKWSKHGTG